MNNDDKEKYFKQKASAGEFRIEAVSGKLNAQWSFKEDRHCLHTSWDSLAKSVGLGLSDIPYLKIWTLKNGKKEPAKKVMVKKLTAEG